MPRASAGMWKRLSAYARQFYEIARLSGPIVDSDRGIKPGDFN